MGINPCVWSDYFSDLSLEQMISTFQQFGFHHTELSRMFRENLLNQGDPDKVGTKVALYCSENGFSIPQGHLSFQKGLCDNTVLEDLKREIDLFHAIGIRSAVLHFNGGKLLPEEVRWDKRIVTVKALQEYVKGTPMTLCLENLGSEPSTHTVQRLKKIIATVGEENMGICLDTGHLHLTNGRGEVEQTQEEFILGAGELLKAMHVTENNGKNDVHQMPYSARYGIDWSQVVKALKQINYQGLFNLEILGEKNAPMPIREAKLRYIKEMTDYMLR